MIQLPQVTLVVIDCVQYERARKSLIHCSSSIQFGSVKLLTHFERDDPYVVRIDQITSIEQYSDFVINRLHNYVDTDYVLVAQWDGFVWHPELWTNEFLQYDYIGAPWPTSLLGQGIPKHYNVGNGGFSLRSKRLIEFLANNPNLTHHKFEDVMISQWNRAYLEASGFKFAPESLAKQFSLENGPLEPAFGSHARIKLI